MRRFWGWYVVAAAAVGLACGIATTVVSTFGVFLGPLRAEFGWSHSEVFSALLVTTLTATPIAPIIGGLVDRYGARRVVLLSFVCEVLLFASFALQNALLWTFYARYVALAALGLGTTHVAFARVITLWFDRRRGLALGIALSGVGIGGFLWPLFAALALQHFGWRMAYLLMAGAIAIIALPLMALLLKDTPESVGQTVDNAAPAAAASAAATSGLSFSAALRTQRYWLLMLTFFLIGISIQSIMVHLVPLLTDRGLSPLLAALAQSTLFVAVTTGRLSTGALMDRFFAPRVAAAFLVAPIVGIALFALGASGVLAFFCAVLVGLAVGAEVDVLAYLTSRYFGPKEFSRIYGSFYGIYSLSGGIGPLLTALVVERGGGYGLALQLHLAALVLACLLLLTYPRPAKMLA